MYPLKGALHRSCRNNFQITSWNEQSVRRLLKQAVGGRPPRYAPPRPATEARSGSLEPGRPSRARSANTRHPAGRRHTPSADRMYATDVRQIDVRQHHRLMGGHNNLDTGSVDRRLWSGRSRTACIAQSSAMWSCCDLVFRQNGATQIHQSVIEIWRKTFENVQFVGQLFMSADSQTLV